MRKILVLTVCILLPPIPAGAADAGPALFKTKCVPCHGVDGSGNTPMGRKVGARPLASAEVQAMTDDELREIVVKGKGKTMPAFGKKLSPGDVGILVAHIRRLAGK